MMTSGHYYDGKSSTRHAVSLTLHEGCLQVCGAGVETSWPLKDASLSMPLGKIRRSLHFPDGSRCDFENRAFAAQIEKAQGKGAFFRGVHRWENSLKLAFAALLLTIVCVVGFIRYGVPVLATRAAYAVPPATENALGVQTLQFLDRTLFESTALEASRQAELTTLFEQVVSNLDATDRNYRLEFRSSERMGANALALPGGTVVVTDQLIALADNEEQIAAVLAHEVGHIRSRHAMRQVIQDSAVGLVVATLTGDVFSASSMAASLPTMLVDAKFSRDMEREADDVAVEYLQKRGESVDHFAAILLSLEQAFIAKRGSSGDAGVSDYFSTHPATTERIQRLHQLD